VVEETAKSFTGRQRKRSTHWSVKVKDRLAHAIITVGGLGTIVAVSTVCIFLVAVVIPLFRPSSSSKTSEVALPRPAESTTEQVPVHTAVDDYNLMAWSVFSDGVVRKFRLDNGELLDEVPLFEGDVKLTAWSFPQRDARAVLGYSDGSVRYANIRFALDFIELEEVEESLRALAPGETATYEKGLVQMTQERQLRHVTLKVELEDPVPTGADQPVVQLDHTGTQDEINYAAMTADGRIFMQRARGRRNMLTNKITYRTTTGEVQYTARGELPRELVLTGLGDNLYVIWADGILERFDTRDYEAISLVETVDLRPSKDVQITAIGYMIGKTTLLVGDTSGGVRGWFRVRPQGVLDEPDVAVKMLGVDGSAEGQNVGEPATVRVADIQTADGLALIPVQYLPGPVPASAVTSLSSSQRKRKFVAGHANGLVRVHNTTIERTIMELELSGGDPIVVGTFNPRDDGLVAVSRRSVGLWSLAIPHAEVTLGAYFRPIWYEGYAEPRHVWQSTGGTDDFEAKLGLMPLIFGTIKATFYSMLFAIPLALLAAIFTSEFLPPKARMRIKPTIEMMASLPSVVLGFLAGLVLAQYIESRVPAVLLSFLTIPLTLITFACIWQVLPRRMQLRFQAWRFTLMVFVVPVGMWVAGQLGPVFEDAFFSVDILDETVAAQIAGEVGEANVEYNDAGNLIVRDFRTWLSAARQDADNPIFKSSATGGWLILFAPLTLLLGAYVTLTYVNPWFLSKVGHMRREQIAWFDFLKFGAATVASLLIAWFVAYAFGLVWDPRGTYIDQYVQRNALVVGFIMGFAVVPIIYTIADDALSAVPEHLRSASLGAGATRWQTAVRIIIPTAMSGLFSAVMIGFGRAVGETMIVLMAAGNTPIMEWNIFNGFRTLSANIAVEMMEAVEGSTNYRTLFLTAVILFLLTFTINTFAEQVRQRYRKRAYQL